MELFRLTCTEAQTLRDETLEKLITFNRELKVNYSTLKENVRVAKLEQERKTKEFAQGN